MIITFIKSKARKILKKPCISLDKKPDANGKCECPSGETLYAKTWTSDYDVSVEFIYN